MITNLPLPPPPFHPGLIEPIRCVLMQGPSHPDVGLVCQEMALLMERTKRLPQARDLLQRGLDIRSVSTSLTPCSPAWTGTFVQMNRCFACCFSDNSHNVEQITHGGSVFRSVLP